MMRRRTMVRSYVRGVDDAYAQEDAEWAAISARATSDDASFKMGHVALFVKTKSPKLSRARALVTAWDRDLFEILGDARSWAEWGLAKKALAVEMGDQIRRQKHRTTMGDYERSFAALAYECPELPAPSFDSPRDIQLELVAQGYDIGPSGADGVISDAFFAALNPFELDHGLPASTPATGVWAATKSALRGDRDSRVEMESRMSLATSEGYISIDDSIAYGKRVDRDIETLNIEWSRWAKDLRVRKVEATPEQKKATQEWSVLYTDWGNFKNDHGNFEKHPLKPGSWPDEETHKEIARFDLMQAGLRARFEEFKITPPPLVPPPSEDDIDKKSDDVAPKGWTSETGAWFDSAKPVLMLGLGVAGVVAVASLISSAKSAMPTQEK